MWFYNGKEFQDSDISDYEGFVYIITNLSNNRKYIGQKKFYNKITKKPLKGKNRKRHSKIISDWKDYYGSNDELLNEINELGKDNYRREIIHLCKGKAEMNYLESKEIFSRDSLISNDYYNSWVSCKINKNQLRKFNG